MRAHYKPTVKIESVINQNSVFLTFFFQFYFIFFVCLVSFLFFIFSFVIETLVSCAASVASFVQL